MLGKSQTSLHFWAFMAYPSKQSKKRFNGVNNPSVLRERFLLKLTKDRHGRLQWLYEARKRYNLVILNYWSRLSSTLVLMIVMWMPAVDAAEPSPEDILIKSVTMLTDDCDFACCYEAAGLYSKRFLKLLREASLASLRTNPDPDNVVSRIHDGKIIALAEYERLTPRERYAGIICKDIIGIPAKYRYSKVEILNAKHLSSDSIEYVVRMSGLKLKPSMKEEAFYRLARENDQWRIDQ